MLPNKAPAQMHGEEQKIFDWFESKYATKPKLQPKMPTFGTGTTINPTLSILRSDETIKRGNYTKTGFDRHIIADTSSFMKDDIRDVIQYGHDQDFNLEDINEGFKEQKDELTIKLEIMEGCMEEFKKTKFQIKQLKEKTLISHDPQLAGKLNFLNDTLHMQKTELEYILTEIQALRDLIGQ